MKALLQRVSRAEVRVAGERVGTIGPGLLVFLCVLRDDRADEARRLAERVATFRCFPDEQGRMNRALAETGRAALVVSQITLAADGRRGRRPSFDRAADPERARELYQTFVSELAGRGIQCAEGVFRAQMEVELVNDGPVTFLLEEGGGGAEEPS